MSIFSLGESQHSPARSLLSLTEHSPKYPPQHKFWFSHDRKITEITINENQRKFCRIRKTLIEMGGAVRRLRHRVENLFPCAPSLNFCFCRKTTLIMTAAFVTIFLTRRMLTGSCFWREQWNIKIAHLLVPQLLGEKQRREKKHSTILNKKRIIKPQRLKDLEAAPNEALLSRGLQKYSFLYTKNQCRHWWYTPHSPHRNSHSKLELFRESHYFSITPATNG